MKEGTDCEDEGKRMILWTTVIIKLTDLGAEGKRRSKDDADISCLSEGNSGNSVNRDRELGAKSGLTCQWLLFSF